jgi:hypothetical protein
MRRTGSGPDACALRALQARRDSLAISTPAVPSTPLPASVHEAADVGCRLVAAIFAPTAPALRWVQAAGVTRVGWTRPPRLTVYCGGLS